MAPSAAHAPAHPAAPPAPPAAAPPPPPAAAASGTTGHSVLTQRFQRASRRHYTGHRKKVHSVVWNCDGTRLASGSVDQTARVWTMDAKTGLVNSVSAIELKGHSHSVEQLCWSPKNPDILATASGDRTIRVWDIKTKCLFRMETQGHNINIAWSPDGNYIAVGDKDDLITIFKIGKTCEIRGCFSFKTEVNEMVFNKDSTHILFTTGAGTVQIMAMHFNEDNKMSLKRVHVIEAHTGPCYCIAFSPDYKYLATGGGDSLVTIWDTDSMVCVRVLDRLDSFVRTVSFSHDSRLIASGSEDTRIDISYVESGEHIYSVPCTAAMNSIAWNPCKLVLAYAGDEKDKQGRDAGSMTVMYVDSEHTQ